MWSSLIPAQVFRKAFVGVEFIARTMVSEMESQHVALIPVGRFEYFGNIIENKVCGKVKSL